MVPRPAVRSDRGAEDKAAVGCETNNENMTNDNIRTKANAVFFSAIMVLSVMAIGFAAAPAAAVNTSNDTITFDDQNAQISDGDVQVTATTTDDDTSDTFDGTVYVTNASDLIVGSTDVTSDGETQVTVENADEFPGTHTAYLSSDTSLSVGDDISDASSTADSDSAFVARNNRAEDDDGNVYITNNSDVFQGEDDIRFTRPDGSQVTASSLEGTSGNREGTPLQMPIPTDQETGSYAEGGADGTGFATTVVQPRITTSEVQLTSTNDDISQVGDDNAANLQIAAEWNFYEAEDLDLTVEDPSGADITNEVLDPATLSSDDGNEETVPLNLQGEDAGEYTVIFEGNDDLDHDEVIEQYTIELTNQDTLTIETAEDSATRGDNLDYTISGGTDGQFHLVAIEDDDFRSNLEDGDSVFRNVQDTTTVGYANSSGDSEGMLTDGVSPNEADYAYAIVEIDGTQGVGSIETASLDDTSVDIDVYSAQGSGEFYNISEASSEDDTDFDVTEGEVSLNSPTDSYTVGAEVDINGTAQSADEVAIYARDNSDWELLDIDADGNDETNGDDYISVDSDDSFEEEDVRLSNASNIYSFEGQYDIGVVDVADLSEYGDDADTLDTSQFSSASSARYTLSVQPGDLTANFQTINGQIADEVDDEITVNGTAAGQDQVVIAFVGQRGDTVTTTATVDSDETFEEEDIPLGEISQGAVSGHVISASRDGQFGDGTIGTDNDQEQTAQNVADAIDDFGGGSSSGDQIRSQIVANTVDDDGSDDLIVNTNFRLNDPTLSIDNVYAEGAEASGLNPVATGETVVIEGTTNRQSENAAITFEMLTQDDEGVASTSVDEWGNDGQFSATIDTSNADLETGTYILEADDGESTDRVNVEVVEEREGDTGEETATPEPDDGTATPEPDTATPEPDTETATPAPDTETATEEPTSTPTSTPGFGVVVALAALLAAALLAVRRND